MSGRLVHPLDLFLEIQLLDRVQRSGYALRGVPDPESVSEHSFHLAFLVWALAADEPDVDRDRAVAIALLHDVAEVRFGDLPRTAAEYLPRGAKRDAEKAVARDLLAPLGAEGHELFDEYEARRTPTARFVKICDGLAIALKARVYLNQGALGAADLAERMATIDDGGFSSIRRLLEELRQRCPSSKSGEPDTAS